MIEGNYYDVHDPTTVPIWSGSSGFSNDFKYSEQLTYDQRGNIKTLLRNGLAYGSMTNTGQASGTFGPIDNLTYTYDPNNPNRITGITDATGSAAGFGFRNSNAYGYDDNGNLIRDDNKQITKIIYNYLNLPTEIQFWNGYAIIKFTYDAAGNKLMKSTFVNGANTGNAGNPANRYYAGGVEYTGSTTNGTGAVIDMIPNAEGFTRHETDGSYSDNFVLRDHLGNTRVVFSDKNNDGYININTELVQVNAYYPFGLNHGANSNGAGAPYKYQYNGKELNDDLGLNWNDYGARFYDPAIGRWNGVDPLAEKTSSWSANVYTGDNPVRFIDPNGMIWKDPKQAENLSKKIDDKVTALTTQKSILQNAISNKDKPVSDKQRASAEKRIEDLSKRIESLCESQKAISELGDDKSHTYALVGGNENGEEDVSKGKDGIIKLSGANDALHIHEIVHVARSLNSVNGLVFNQYSSLKPVDPTGAKDEVAAYRAQYGYEPSTLPRQAGNYPENFQEVNVKFVANITRTDGTYVYPVANLQWKQEVEQSKFSH